MQIILAIDIINGKVVKAFAGDRFNYKPLMIKNKDYSDPLKLINRIKKIINIKDVYLADLNSIRKNGSNDKLIDQILRIFPDINFLIDAGFDYPLSVYKYQKKKDRNKLKNFNIVLGTETLREYKLQTFSFLKKFYLSLDFNGDEIKWLNRIRKEKKELKIILMFINNVGGRGINLKLIEKFNKVLSHNEIIIAGGIRYYGDIFQLSRMGIGKVIVATFLHRLISRDF